MHQPAYRAFELALYGDDVSVPAHGHDAVLKIFVIGGRGDEKLKFGLDVVAEFPYAKTDGAKLGRGVVRHFRLGDEGVEDVLFQLVVRIQPRKHSVQPGHPDDGSEGLAYPSRYTEGASHAQKFRDGEHGALFRLDHGLFDVVHGKGGRDGKLKESPVRFRRHVQRELRLTDIGGGQKGAASRLAALRLCVGGKHIEDLAVFERIQALFVEHNFYPAVTRGSLRRIFLREGRGSSPFRRLSRRR